MVGRREQLIGLCLAAVILFGLGYKYALLRSPDIPQVEKGHAQREEEGPHEVVVHVAGAVVSPGLYRLPQGARVNDALEKAGPLDDADLDALNLAALLEDQQKIFVPLTPAAGGASANAGVSSGTVPVGSNPFAGSATGGGGKININTADAALLEQLAGIGPALATRIVQYREENGPFASVEDLLNVPGIGEKKLEDLRDGATVQ